MFTPQHDDQQHTIRLPMPPSRCFGFFTPEGERLWVEDWNPIYYHRPAGDSLEGTVFSTAQDGAVTWWTVVHHDIARGTVRYNRLTPGVRAAIVDVECAPAGDGSEVTVRYRQVGLDDKGNDLVRQMGGAAFRTMIETWEKRISALPAVADPA
ncbi:hypothetical protein J5N58_25610 [Rhizobium cremeum]|uniref:hypothetical protein n=1 Tax=Rhizobium cremeum TaxID=2813827 RepID=UPI001FD4C57E|nr:hypothetical protein [Rhizobium cremeum]MCJ7997969.1 hypothetical protein [Rhizobium cremeum]MCJ8003063.1 hypothetical protein [Rhizobium cremeum]